MYWKYTCKSDLNVLINMQTVKSNLHNITNNKQLKELWKFWLQ